MKGKTLSFRDDLYDESLYISIEKALLSSVTSVTLFFYCFHLVET